MVIPALRTHAARSSGVDVPSDAVVCMCRSIIRRSEILISALPIPVELAIGDRGHLLDVQPSAEEFVQATGFGSGIVDDVAITHLQRGEAPAVAQEAPDFFEGLSGYLPPLRIFGRG